MNSGKTKFAQNDKNFLLSSWDSSSSARLPEPQSPCGSSRAIISFAYDIILHFIFSCLVSSRIDRSHLLEDLRQRVVAICLPVK